MFYRILWLLHHTVWVAWKMFHSILWMLHHTVWVPWTEFHSILWMLHTIVWVPWRVFHIMWWPRHHTGQSFTLLWIKQALHPVIRWQNSLNSSSSPDKHSNKLLANFHSVGRFHALCCTPSGELCTTSLTRTWPRDAVICYRPWSCCGQYVCAWFSKKTLTP